MGDTVARVPPDHRVVTQGKGDRKEWVTQLHVFPQITGVVTQGKGDSKEWVTKFHVSHSMDAYVWTFVSDHYGNKKVGKKVSNKSAHLCV